MNKYNKMCSGPYQNNDKPNCDHYHTYNNNGPSNSKGPYMKCKPTPNLLNDPNLKYFDIPTGESITDYRIFQSYLGNRPYGRNADISLGIGIEEGVTGSKLELALGYGGGYYDRREYVITQFPSYIEFGTGNVEEVLISASGPMKGWYYVRPYCVCK
ncbi:hypothetical protein FOA24_36615 [Bacillus thuringiensis]|uniref:hypothetical protein n=1 Tax=Bacillus thuringiensis TaxID=1428 RepID=UPI00333D6648